MAIVKEKQRKKEVISGAIAKSRALLLRFLLSIVGSIFL